MTNGKLNNTITMEVAGRMSTSLTPVTVKFRQNCSRNSPLRIKCIPYLKFRILTVSGARKPQRFTDKGEVTFGMWKRTSDLLPVPNFVKIAQGIRPLGANKFC